MKIEFGRDWSEFLRLLISKRVKFVLIGGHAVAGHGEPRLTEDLDVLVEASLANARRLASALRDFGFGSATPSVEDLAQLGKIWMLGRKPWRIDILTQIDGVEFSEVWRGRVELQFEKGRLPVIGVAELIRNKRAAGRPKDLGDVAALEAARAHESRAGKRAGKRRRPAPATSRGDVKRAVRRRSKPNK
ncbi:MAG TPA: hypothetical protein VI072_06745 [Polyangiaceae bacterium]